MFKPEQGNHGNRGIAQHVPAEHHAAAQPLCGREADKLGVQHLDQGGAQVAQQDRAERQRQGQRRQEQVVEVLDEAAADAANREPAQACCQGDQQNQPDVEHRHRETQLREAADHRIGPAALSQGRQKGERNGGEQSQEGGHRSQQHCDRQPLSDQQGDRNPHRDRLAQIQRRYTLEKLPELHRDRAVQPKVMM